MDDIAAFWCHIRQIIEENITLRRRAARWKAAAKKLWPDRSPYCPTCGACGEPGCCPPTQCHHLKCQYGESYVKGLIEENGMLSELVNRTEV